ncbi:unnamed protein product, partial [Symbiodinium natans]
WEVTYGFAPEIESIDEQHTAAEAGLSASHFQSVPYIPMSDLPRSCSMDPDGCISSTGYQDIGGQYPDNDACTIAVASDNMQAIDVVAFSTEAGKDRLLVNGVAYDGSTGPVDIVPTADITWSSDAQTVVSQILAGRSALERCQVWVLESGSCRVDGACISSSNFPNAYPNNDRCVFSAAFDPRRPRVIDVASFATELDWDILTIDGVQFSGTGGPAGVLPRERITWAADESVTDSGWKICLAAAEAALAWRVASGSCSMDPDGCISSTGYQDIGGQYPDNDACTIAVASDNMQAIDVVAFSTEAGKDRLLVNGVAYDGSTGPVDIVPTADITWSSDGGVTDSGWKICPGSVWVLESGSCRVDGACISSSNFPNAYPNNDRCVFSAAFDPRRPRVIDVASFATELDWDILTIDGVQFSGTGGPAGVLPRERITWAADESVTDSGWKICLAAAEAALAWRVASGSCSMDPDGCISSTGYQDIGGQYPDNDACTIAVASDNMQAIDVVAFSTEAGKDRLLVNGVAYDGSTGPVDIVPTADITWSSDGGVTDSGWKICLRTVWVLESGSCRVDGACISSSNFPNAYPNNDRCVFSAAFDPRRGAQG